MPTDSESGNLNSSEGILAKMSDAIAGVVADTAIPEPIRRNAFKAFDRLCTAAIEVPAAYLEGLADERRAETLARTKIIAATTAQITSALSVPKEVAHSVANQFSKRILREKANLDAVVKVAVDELHNSSPKNLTPSSSTAGADAELGDDWLNTFEHEASLKSTEDMQRLFGRILAGAIRAPSQFSIKTLRRIGEIDAQTAKLFVTVCSMSVALREPEEGIIDARILTLGNNAKKNGMAKYGLLYVYLVLLEEYGLIAPSFGDTANYSHFVVGGNPVFFSQGFWFQNKYWLLEPIGELSKSPLIVESVTLTQLGRELLTVVSLESSAEYFADFSAFFSNQGYRLVEVKLQC